MSASGDDFGGVPLFDLFKLEVEAHTKALDEGLLALEEAPQDAARLDALMRAAHSMKGAARLVGLDAAVGVAHVMEDVLVAAQKGRRVLGAASVDALLAGNDLLKEIVKRDEAGAAAYLAARAAELAALVERLRAVERDEGATAPAAPAPAVAAVVVAPAPGVPSAATSAPRDDGDAAAVRVSATGLGRMLAYAGESLVEARRLGATASALDDVRSLAGRLLAAAEGLGGSGGPSAEGVRTLRDLAAQTRRRVASHLEALDAAARRSEDLAERLYREVLKSRMRPFGDVVGGFPRLVRDLARDLGKRAQLEVRGKDVLVDRDLLDALDAPVNQLLRNAVDHGLEPPERRAAAGKDPEGRVMLKARHRAGMLEIEVVDDGRGVDYEGLRRRVVERGLVKDAMAGELSRAELLEFLFLPAFSTKQEVTEVSGRGVGLDVVHTLASALGGTVRATSEAGKGFRVVLTAPITRSVIRAALVEIGGEPHAFPLARIERLVRVPTAEIHAVEGRESFAWEGAAVGLVPAARALGLDVEVLARDAVPVVLLAGGGHLYGLAVDRFLGEQDLVVRALDPRLGKVENVAAVSVDESGAPVLILDVDDLLRSVDQLLHDGRLRSVRVTAPAVEASRRRRKRVLVVDDSITVREVERGLLAARGFLVDVAVDGADGWNAVRANTYDLVITDVDMPRMNGIELVRHIKQDTRLRELPVMIVSYKDRDADRLAGLEAGADAYVTKSSFHEDAWIGRVVELVGEPEEDAP